jgi:hypothetical protein
MQSSKRSVTRRTSSGEKQIRPPQVAMHRVFVIQPVDQPADRTYEFIASAAASAGVTVARFDSYHFLGDTIETIHAAIQAASLVIADVSIPNANVMYEFGFAHAQNKPVLLVTRSGHTIPFDIASSRAIIYDEANPAESIKRLATAILEALANPDRFLLSGALARRQASPNVFISYCHADREYLDRLLVHLKPLEKAGFIDLWVDTRLRAGDRWKSEIENALGRATVAVLLICADFLASDFITDNELPPLLRNAGASFRMLPSSPDLFGSRPVG